MKNVFAKIPKGYRIAFFSFLVLVFVSLVTWEPLATSYGKWLAAGESNPKADMSVLLSGSKQRLETLIHLYTQGRVNAVYYAAGIDETSADLEAYRSIFSKYDIPSENLYCGGLVKSTYNEAQTFQRKLAEIKRPVKRIVLVSDRYHLRRGIWTFQQVFGKDLEITAYSTPSSPEIADSQWWKHQTAREQVLSETKKLAFYMVYYGLLGRESLLTHGDYDKLTKGKVAKGVNNPCQVVLPQLTNTGQSE
ncbi:MAG: ElyC/SanA/YdcF family protein [Kovacikia sp.]